MGLEQKTDTRAQYSQKEAAEKLGVSHDQLKAMVRKYISRDAELANHSMLSASDLVVLRILANSQPESGAASAGQ